MRIRSYLLLVALVAGVPGLIVGALLMWWSATLQKHSIEVGVRDTARALALAVDRELFRARAIARTIAASREIDSANFAALHQQAADMSDASGWVTLLKRDGEQVINALRPYGSPIPRAAGMANIDNVFAKSEVVISNLFQGAVAARPIITVAAPVIRDGKVLYAAQFSFGVEQFQELLSGQDLSAGWVATIQDRNGITIARSPNAERWVGKPASATFATALERAPEGVGRGTSRDGTDMLFAWATSEESGWKVAVGAPVELIDAPLWRMSIAFGIAALFVIAGMVAAFVIARRVNDNIAYSVKRFSEAAIALGHGAPLALHEGRNISEIEAARKSLLWASEAVQKRVADEERARHEAVAANQAKDEFIATLAHEVRTPLSAIATCERPVRRGPRGHEQVRIDSSADELGGCDRQLRGRVGK